MVEIFYEDLDTNAFLREDEPLCLECFKATFNDTVAAMPIGQRIKASIHSHDIPYEETDDTVIGKEINIAWIRG